MVKVLNLPNRANMLAESLGGGFSKGLSGGLELLVNQKIKNLAAQQERRQDYEQTYATAKGYGLSDEQAKAIAMTPPAERVKMTPDLYLGRLASNRNLQLQNDQTIPGNQPNDFQQIFENRQQQQQQLAELLGQQDIKNAALQQMGVKTPQSTFAQQMQFNELAKQVQQPQNAQQLSQQQQQATQQQNGQLSDIAEDIKLGRRIRQPQIAVAEETLEFKKKHAEEQKQQHQKEFIDKKYEKYNTDLTEKADAAGNASRDLGLQINLLKNGDLNKPSYIGALKKLGIDLPFLIKGDSIALDKSAISLAQHSLKTNFGSRPTDFGFEKTLQSVPNSLHNKNDALNLAYRLNAQQDAQKALFNARNEIIEENGGYSPANLPALVEKRASDKLDSLNLQYNYALPSPKEAIEDKKPALYTYGKLFVTDGTSWQEAKLTADQRKAIERQTSGKK